MPGACPSVRALSGVALALDGAPSPPRAIVHLCRASCYPSSRPTCRRPGITVFSTSIKNRGLVVIICHRARRDVSEFISGLILIDWRKAAPPSANCYKVPDRPRATYRHSTSGITRGGLPHTGDGVFDFAKHQVAQAKGGFVTVVPVSRGASRNSSQARVSRLQAAQERPKSSPAADCMAEVRDIPTAIPSSSLELLNRAWIRRSFPMYA